MAPRGKVTIADVAKAAGVSSGTVSRVLNWRAGEVKISDSTRRLVLEKVEQLGYQANPFASALRSQQSGVIGAIVRDIHDPFLSLMAREVQRVAHAQGIEFLLGHAEYNLETVRSQLKFMRNWFDGLLMIGDMSGDHAIMEELQSYGTPFVAVACGTRPLIPLVNTDEASGTCLSMDYLHALGHRRIGFIGNTEHEGVQERFEAFMNYVQEKALYWTEAYAQHSPYTRRAAITCVQRLLSLPEPPTAIFCTADLLALGAVSGALQIGWRVPESISIIGFDDIEESAYSYPPLTTVRQPVGEMAQAAMDLLMKQITGPKSEDAPKRVLIKPSLKVRRSCSPPRHGAY